MEAEEEGKRRLGEEIERLDVLGQDSDAKAMPWVRREFEEQVKREQIQREIELTQLQKLLKYKHHKDYFRFLTTVLIRYAREEDIPKKYNIDLEITDLGVVVRIKGTKYVGAFKPSGLPSYDHLYCKVMAMKLGNTVARLQGYRQKTEGGILIPDEQDLKELAHG